jgi:uncharacterized membrane protein YkvA (DUF1232 family)
MDASWVDRQAMKVMRRRRQIESRPAQRGGRGPLAARLDANHMKVMAFARTAFWRADRRDNSDETLRRRFWRKLTAVAAHIPFAGELLAAYYCAFDRATPLHVKATLVGAIAYFVLPVDAIPDLLPVIGFTDDAAVLTTAIRLVAGHITPEHRSAAKERLAAMMDSAAPPA